MFDKRCLIVWILAAAAAVRAVAAEKPEVSKHVSTSQCRLWLARSSTGTDFAPKLGLYTGVDLEPNESIGNSEIGIPLVDFVESWNRKSDVSNHVLDFLEGFLWTAEFAGAKWEGNHSVTVAIPGIGVLANFHSGTFNVDWDQSAVLLNEAVVFPAGKSNPSRGAITTFSNLTLVAKQPIKAGMELFANFGDIWDGNHTENVFQDKLTRWDYQDADRILDAILLFMKKYDTEMSPELKDDILEFIMGKVLGTAAGAHAKVIRSLIPAHPGKLQTVKDMGGTFAYRNPDLVKSQKWLEKHGTCMDNLEVKLSKNTDAGRGAFATRAMKKGTIISPMPMLHVSDKAVMDFYELIEQKGENGSYFEPDPSKPVKKQLALNYCFGHPESSMLLLPVGGIVSQINHSPEPNARITWSKNKHWGNAHEWHDATVQRCAEEERIGIVMEVYATKDISEGDEVTIDYGAEWSMAWEEHMKAFDPTKEWQLKAVDLKPLYKDHPYKTTMELEADPYPQGVTTSCFILSETMTDGKPKVNSQGNERTLWIGPKEHKGYVGSAFYSCNILERSDDSDGDLFKYTVLVSVSGNTVEVVGVPHNAITFVDSPYSSDTFTPGAFRHWIGIPDVIFPQAWRDLRG